MKLTLLLLLLIGTGCAQAGPISAPSSSGATDPKVALLNDQDTNTFIIKGNFDLFTTDELGNLYTLLGDELILYNKQGIPGLRNSVKVFGKITNIDAFYSMKPMVFSREQGMLAVLDNTLSVQGSPIDLSRDFPQVVLAAMSVQNNFWLFDERELSILRVDGQLRPLADTGRLDQLLGFTPRPVSMHEHDSWLYVNDPANGILVFDLFGTYARTIPVMNAHSFQVRGKEMYFFKEGGLYLYDMHSFNIVELALPPDINGILNARVERGRTYVQMADRILIAPIPHQH